MGIRAGPERRRVRLLELLRQSEKPLSGAALARRLRLSRQVIVQDIAVLRAAGHPIQATPRGYVLWRPPEPKNARSTFQAVIASKHGKEECEDELTALVDLGVRVVDVFVEHPIYGEIRRPLMIQSRQDVREFMERLNNSGAELLCELTGGVHQHTLEAPRQDLLEKALKILDARGYLVK
jgi:transcriptional regulator of NAD metabolism